MSKGYGKDIKMAFFNSPDEARHKLFKVIESSQKKISNEGKDKYVVICWTTTSSFPQMLGRFADIESALEEFNKRVEQWRKVESQFKLVGES